MKYSDKLKSPKWQKKRLEVLQRDNFECFYCGENEKTLHVHHEMYLGKDPWDTPTECLTTVCENCHSFIHETKKNYTELERFLISCVHNRDGKENWESFIKIVKDIKIGGYLG